MKLLTTLAVLLTGATQASAANLRNWECADGISISYMYTAARDTAGAENRESFVFEIGGDREFFKTINGRATIAFVTDKKTGYHKAIYLNGQRCHETTGIP
jgi:hypothetical protein